MVRWMKILWIRSADSASQDAVGRETADGGDPGHGGGDPGVTPGRRGRPPPSTCPSTAASLARPPQPAPGQASDAADVGGDHVRPRDARRCPQPRQFHEPVVQWAQLRTGDRSAHQGPLDRTVCLHRVRHAALHPGKHQHFLRSIQVLHVNSFTAVVNESRQQGAECGEVTYVSTIVDRLTEMT